MATKRQDDLDAKVHEIMRLAELARREDVARALVKGALNLYLRSHPPKRSANRG